MTGQGIKAKDIIILSPYRAQCFEITEKLKTVGLKEIPVTSVVAAQGKFVNILVLLQGSIVIRRVSNRRGWTGVSDTLPSQVRKPHR